MSGFLLSARLPTHKDYFSYWRFHVKRDNKDDEKFRELVKRMKTFNELLGDYLDAIDMEEGDTEKEDN